MRKFITLITIFAFLSGCSEKTTDRTDDLYLIIKEIETDFKYDSFLVVLELNKAKFNSAIFINTQGDTSQMIPPPPPPPSFNFYYDKVTFYKFVKDSLLTESESEFMINQIENAKDYILDSSRIDVKTIHHSILNSLLKNYDRDSTYNYLMSKYNMSSYIQFSTPLFTIDDSKVVITMDFHCFDRCGRGETYLLGKKKGKWSIIYKETTWTN